ncbi:iron(III) transport system substrate-binding protein [Promicromonospora umidemergens]|uniref:Iron(III) transport system substrate-binding protein n=1 Tax=Promicromonospora umidemergens TaxID=629679 RepID=A0ABP8WGK0_9MICO|nr:ABC transporter substrate-binding protein [Promicromonospora umidemergens]MCP2284045.1 iron(III) transport system substrate-binding protein [Promicromonospora umidemergens]
MSALRTRVRPALAALLPLTLCFGLAACATPGADADTDDTTDWGSVGHDELVELAEEEGEVVVYAFTSRIAAVEESFEAEYPGIDVVASDISSSELITRLASEHAAGTSTADVAYVSDAPVVVTELLADGVLVPYLPARLADVLPEEYREPLVANRLSTKVLMYNEEAHPDGSPVSNLWQLTDPSWAGKVVLVDPNVRGDYLDLATELSLRADEMAAAYADQFGEELVLDDGVPDAGLQFLKDLYDNEAVLVDDTDTVNAAVGAVGQDDPPVGFTSYSDRRDNEDEGWALQVASGVAPSNGIVFPAYLGATENAANPAAARLLIDYMMGDDTETGGAGFDPFYVAGDYPTRSDVTPPADALPLEELGAWEIDAETSAEHRGDVADFLLTIQ